MRTKFLLENIIERENLQTQKVDGKNNVISVPKRDGAGQNVNTDSLNLAFHKNNFWISELSKQYILPENQ
jgi:hypothetical protein